MIDVLFFLDFEEGHIFPTYKVADDLVEAGYKVAYMGVPYAMEIVAKQGFEVYTIFEDLYPDKASLAVLDSDDENVDSEKHFVQMLHGRLDDIFREIDPGMVIISSFMYLEPLVLKYSYNLSPIIFKPMLPELEVFAASDAPYSIGQASFDDAKLRLLEANSTTSMELVEYMESKGVVIEKLEDLLQPLTTMKHIVPCPKEFEISHELIDETVSYLGPCIRRSTLLSDEELQAFMPKRVGKKIIFASVGSQIHEYPERANRFFKMVIDCMRSEAFADYSLILSAGSRAKEYTDLPDNMAVFSWVPQVSLLQKVSAAIIHGGMGTIKECIFYGVPTLVIPMGRDQYDNAKRIVATKIGLSADIDQLTEATLQQKILTLLQDSAIQSETHKMMEVFQKAEAEKRALEVVEQTLDKFEI